MFKFLILITMLFTSCSSFSKAKWELKDVPLNERIWRRCNNYDGPNDGKGYCYKERWCIKKFMKKENCKPKILFCEYGNSECMRINKYPEIRRGY